MKEQIEEMAKLMHPDICRNIDTSKCLEMNGCDICHATKLYNAGYRKQEWISVEERVPEKYVTVLCFCPEKDYGSKIVPDYAENDKGYFANQFRYGAPSHWMPLPEPPSEVEVKDYPAYLDRPKMKGGAE